MASASSIYPRLDESINVPEQEIEQFITNLQQASRVLDSVTTQNISSARTELQQILINCQEVLARWMIDSKGSLNSIMMALYIKTANFAMQVSALAGIRNTNHQLNDLFTQLQSFARGTQALNASEQLKFNLLSNSNQQTTILNKFIVHPRTNPDKVIGFTRERQLIANQNNELYKSIRPSTERSATVMCFFGPPGTGKTFFAQAVARDLNADFLVFTAAQLLTPRIGESEQILTDVFAALRIYPRKAVVFFDEFEQIFPSRSDSNALEVNRSLTVLLLQLLDGAFAKLPDNITLIAATNLLDNLDPALRSRMTPQLLIDLPTQENKRTFLEGYFSRQQVADILNANSLERYSNRDLFTLCESIFKDQVGKINRSKFFYFNPQSLPTLHNGVDSVGLAVAPDQEYATPPPLLPIQDASEINKIDPAQIYELNIAQKQRLSYYLQRPNPMEFLSTAIASVNPLTVKEDKLYVPYREKQAAMIN